MKLGLFKRGQKGLTLVELMVVMAILAVLAAMIMPAVSGTQEVSRDAQVKSDAGLVSTAVSDYYKDQGNAEVLTPLSTKVLDVSTTEETSTRWPELRVQAKYPAVFPVDLGSAAGNVTAVIITPLVGANITEANFLLNYTAVDLGKLATTNYIPAGLKSADTKSDAFNNYLWVMTKTTASGGVTGASRAVKVFRLSGVQKATDTGTITLNYVQIY